MLRLKPWLLAVDIGNTNVTLGALSLEKTQTTPRLLAGWRLATHRHATGDELSVTVQSLFTSAGLGLNRLGGVAVASVVPPLDLVFRELSEKHLKQSPLFVGAGVKTGVKILYDSPAEVGADRIVNAAAAYARVRGPLIVVDFGTATTFDCVNGRGAYLGGAIAPGPQMSAEILYQRTAKLPLLGAFCQPPHAIGKNTQDSIASGLFHGYVGLTRGLIAQLAKEMGGKPSILATGGLSPLLAPSLPEINDVVPDLTLEGLWRIWWLNRVKK
ncbi:MAG: type III pantothenate kinase [Elusimicrobia bacterium]|nr:type III pantothenate kinase [Elusimicrobiota bacterium]